MSEENIQNDEQTNDTEQPEQSEQPTGETENQGQESMFDGLETGAEQQEEPTEGIRPDGLEDKFWDEENKQIKVDQVLESYKHLRKKVGEKFEVPEAYDLSATTIQFPEETINSFKEAGLTQKQAQAVATELQERLLSQVEQREVAVEMKELQNHWGSPSSESFQNRLQSVFDYAVEVIGDVEMAKNLTRSKGDVLMWEARLKGEMTKGRIEMRHPESKSMLSLHKVEQRMSDPRNNPSTPQYDSAFREETDRMWEQLERQGLGS